MRRVPFTGFYIYIYLFFGGTIQLQLTDGAPPSAGCTIQTRGQMIVDSANAKLYMCVESGWKWVVLQ